MKLRIKGFYLTIHYGATTDLQRSFLLSIRKYIHLFVKGPDMGSGKKQVQILAYKASFLLVV